MPGRPNLELELRRGSELLKKHELKDRKFFILGRQPVMSHILVEDDTVSRQHAALVHCGAALYLFDLKSAKGVAVGGKPIKPMEPRLLSEGDAITLGELAVQYVVKGLGAPPAASDRWQPPAWAVVPTRAVHMRLMRGETAVQELDLSRKPAYVMGRNGQQADLMVPHDSVSRQHAALVHGAPTADGSSSVHVVDLKSTMGTFIDQGRGEWKRLPPNTPTVLPVGGRVRLGECSTLLVYPGAAPPPPTKAAAEVEDDAPRFASMLQSTIIKDAMVSHGVQSETVSLYDESGPTAASNDANVAAAEEGGEEAAQVSNNDIRNMLLPFIRKPAPAVEESADDGGRKRRKKKRKGGDDDSSDDEREPPPPITLDKLGPGTDDLSGGLVLRKSKAPAKSSSTKKSTPKIKF